MASSSSSSVPPTSTTSTEDTTRDVIYKLLLAKLMEAQSSSLGGGAAASTTLQQPPVPPVAAAAADPNNGYQHGGGALGALSTSMAPPTSLLSQLNSQQQHAAMVGGGGSGLSPPSTSASSALFPSSSSIYGGIGGGGMTTPTKENRIGQKRSSPYSESRTPPAAPPLSAAAAAGAAPFTSPLAATSPTSVGSCSSNGGGVNGSSSSLPNFLLVKITDLTTVDTLQNLLASHGFTETRLVLANGEQPLPVPTGASVAALQQDQLQQQPLSPPAATASMTLASYGGHEMLMDVDQDPILNDHHHQLQLLQNQQQPGSRRDSMLRLHNVPDVAATEEVKDDDEYDENVEVVEESSLTIGLPSSSTPYAQMSPPLNGNEPPTDIQVAEVRHRSVSRSDGVDNEDVYVKCRLCENRIMNTRLSNLTNHVRRHAKLKQFQCSHCNYEHNEIFKVRTHMSRAHGDTHSAPLDRRSPEMERQWEALMHACFPRNSLLHPQLNGKDHGLHSSASFSHPSSSNGESSLFSGRASYSPGSSLVASKAAMHAARGRYSPAHTASPPGMYTCSSCKESIAEDSLQSHIREEHSSLLAMMSFYICRECGFKSSQKDKVRLHAVNSHDVTDVMSIPVESRPSLALQKLFPEKRVVTNEECDAAHVGHDHHRVEDEDEEGETTNANGGMHHNFTCRMCARTLNSSQGALIHAKKHYPTRQFHCTLCLYQAVDEAKVRAHLLTKHMSIDLPINVADAPMQRGWKETMESCFPELANATGIGLIGTMYDDIGEDCESDTKRRKLERAAAAQAAAARLSDASRSSGTDGIDADADGDADADADVDGVDSSHIPPCSISPSTTCHIVKATEAEEEEEIDVV
ncbi:hypothetical protein PFISCL1PPCAC_20627 [Pristionchus fissidentatus]|uniref:C2H2-type domain-containing protein n=1 Tax=Pristionchus fissidentatus TaxID=1538716 RepID=A0AAV5WCA1_9BILA|nr:hypothetical protein PFISCL1PPCAC_20627 [Pristionchus fissidentatus]